MYGEAPIYKPYLDRQRLKDPLGGVAYFKTTLRPHFVKGNSSVFLWRFFQLTRFHRGTQEIQTWSTRMLTLTCLTLDAWMDIQTPADQQGLEFRNDLAQLHAREQNDGQPQTPADVAFGNWRDRRRQRWQETFPSGQNLLA